MIEFADFQCPYCGQYARTTYQAIKKEFIEPGKIRYAFLNFPLVSHPMASTAAEAAVCADRQGRFWLMHDQFFSHPESVSNETMDNNAQSVGLSLPVFRACLNVDAAKKVAADRELAQRIGVKATPTFVIGDIAKNGVVHAELMIEGTRPIETYRSALQAQLDMASKGRRPVM